MLLAVSDEREVPEWLDADVDTAYTIYAFFEWSLILFDVGFDAVTALDFEGFELRVVDTKGLSKGYVRLPLYRKD